MSDVSWGHFYEGSGDKDYYDRHVDMHALFLNKIANSGGQHILEAGCGSGIMSVYFSKEKNYDCVAIDQDAEVLTKASQSALKLGGKVNFRPGNIFDLPFADNSFDIVFSQGVWEHFGDDDIRRTVKEQLRVAPRVFASIPSKYYNHQDFGDERLMTDKAWKKILGDLGKVHSEYYMYERVKRNFLLKKPLMLWLEVARS